MIPQRTIIALGGLLALLTACRSGEANHPAASAPESTPAVADLATVRVAACQILVDGDYEAALARVEAALVEAKEQRANIACFPEACLYGWVNPEAHRLAEPIPGATTERLGAMAKRHGIMIAIGLAERAGNDLHNAAVLIGEDGSLLLHHRKVNILKELMSPPYSPGDGEASFADTRFGRIGMMICADTFEDELVGRLASVRPDLVLVPYGWAAPADAWPGHGQSLHAWIAHTATVTSAPVVGVDSVGALSHGPWEGQILGGQSAVSDAQGVVGTPLLDRVRDVHVFAFPRPRRAD